MFFSRRGSHHESAKKTDPQNREDTAGQLAERLDNCRAQKSLLIGLGSFRTGTADFCQYDNLLREGQSVIVGAAGWSNRGHVCPLWSRSLYRKENRWTSVVFFRECPELPHSLSF